MEKRKSGKKTNFLLLLATVLICLLMGEGVVRLLKLGPPPAGGFSHAMIHDDTLGWRGVPNTENIHHVAGSQVLIKTNELGFRDSPLPPWEDVENKIRVIFLGDSYCWGFGVRQEECISEVIESLDPEIEAYNFGMFGYSTDQELLCLQRYADLIKPNYVVLLFCLNDLIYNDSDIGHRVPKPHFGIGSDGKLILGNIPVPHRPKPGPILAWLQKNSSLYRISAKVISLIQAQLSFQQQRHRAGGAKTVRPIPAHGVEEQIQLEALEGKFSSNDLTTYLLRDLSEECNRLGAGLIVIMVPSSQAWTEKQAETPEVAQRVLEACSQLGIQTLNLYPTFHQKYQETGDLLFVDDFEDRMHWNGNGHRLAAEALYPLIRDSLTIRPQRRGWFKSSF